MAHSEAEPRTSSEFNLLFDQLRAICSVARAIPVAAVEAYLAEIERTNALMPVIDPTAYRRVQPNIPSHRDLWSAFLVFRREIAKYEDAA